MKPISVWPSSISRRVMAKAALKSSIETAFRASSGRAAATPTKGMCMSFKILATRVESLSGGDRMMPSQPPDFSFSNAAAAPSGPSHDSISNCVPLRPLSVRMPSRNSLKKARDGLEYNSPMRA